jgi:S-adenosylmethionine decarboxylase
MAAELDVADLIVDDLCSYIVDVWVSDSALLTDKDRLLALMRAAAEEGEATILGEASHTFPNGAVTAILLLSASHLSVHTWPEYSLANVDLLAYGRLKGDRMMASLEAGMSVTRVNATRILRAVH